MKRKILSFVLVMCLIVPFAFMLSACGANNNGGGLGTGQGGSGGSGDGGEENIPSISAIRDLDVTVIKTNIVNASATLVRLPDGKNLLIDAGSYSERSVNSVKAKLDALEVTTIDYFVITNSNTRRAGGGSAIFETYVVKNFYRPNIKATHESASVLTAENNTGATAGYECNSAYYANTLIAAQNEQNCVITTENKDCDINCEFKYNDTKYSYKIDFLTPTTEKNATSFANSNDYSAMICIEFQGKKILFASDATATTEETFVSTYPNLNVDILVVANYGDSASTTEAFLNVTKPEYALISVHDSNMDSWPHNATLGRLQAKNIPVYRTDFNGNITAKITVAGELSISHLDSEDTSENYYGRD